MPFWGIEIEPGKSYTYPIDSGRRKLRLTQATLGTGRSNVRATLQINVANKKPIILCNLLPNFCENFSMQLEFEESEHVRFSVLGGKSIHLAGYLVDSKLDGNESDSIGEDIENTESSGSYGDCSDLDKYESDFIDDDDDDDEVTILPSPKCDGKDLKETSCGNTSRRRLKKAYEVDSSNYCKFQVGSKSESIFNIESDDSDDSLLASSFQKKRRDGKKSCLKTDGVSESANDGECKENKKKSKEKKTKKSKKAKDASPLVVEVNQNPSTVAPQENENGDDIGKKERAKEHTSEVASPRLVSESAIHSEDDAVGKKKRKAKKKPKENQDENHLALAGEAADHSSLVASDTTQENARKVDKKSKKRTRSEVPEL